MDFYFPDRVAWQHSQGLYHAAAYLKREAVIVVRPATPYVCIGYHQDARQEIDLEFAARHDLAVFRREVGGGAVYLDSQQLFYQFVLRRDHPAMPASKAELYRRFLEPVAETYRAFGVEARYRPVNDIVTAEGRKISGTGAGEIGDMIVLVGNFILDFDYDRMSKVLRVPDEKFRDKVYKTMRDNLTTIQRETGRVPETAELAEGLRQRLEPLLGTLVQREVDAEWLSYSDRLMAERLHPDWLFEAARPRTEREVKIAEGVHVIERALKTPGGLLRVTAVVRDGRLDDVHLSGDFFFYPASRLIDLAHTLNGIPAQPDTVTAAVNTFYQRYAIESPGVQVESFAEALAIA